MSALYMANIIIIIIFDLFKLKKKSLGLSLFIIVISFFVLFFLCVCFRFGALAGLGAFVRAGFLCVSVLRVASGPRVKLAGCESAFNPPGSLLYWPFWGGDPGVFLNLCCFVVYSMRRFVVCLSVCRFILVFFGPFSIAITSLGGRES